MLQEILADEADVVPVKFNFNETFKWPGFTGKLKQPVVYRNG
jgi:hypothetical protein